jgi:dUTP pyrophosphatase
MIIYVKKVEGVVLPEKGSQVAAGYDIVAASDPKIVGEKLDEGNWSNVDYIEYETNLFIAPSARTFHTLIHPRSSISKYHLVLANSIGLVDNDYRGMIICRFKYIWQPEDFSLISDGRLIGSVNVNKLYKKGDKIGQLVVEQTVGVEWEFVNELTETQRGSGGFGSSDIKKPEFPPNRPTVGKPIKFDEQPSNLAEKFRNLNYTDPTKKNCEQLSWGL